MLQSKSELLAFYRDGLLNNVIPFWSRYAADHQLGGFMTCLDRDGTIIDTDKAIWQQGRAAWLFAKLYNHVERREEWLELARSGVQFLDRHGTDPQDGRMWFLVTRDGRPLRKRRYAFSESFAAIAYAEFARATGNEDYARKALGAFDRFVQHNMNPPAGIAKHTDTRPSRSIGFPMITMNIAQELRESLDWKEGDEWIDRSIDIIRSYHVHEDMECVMETVGLDGERLDHFDGRTLNPGHAIEAAWFILWEGRHRGDAELISLGCRMLDWMWGRGWDQEYGGILYFVDVRGLPVQEYWHDMKFWWPQCETILATLLAWKLTGEQRYAQWHQQIHDWAFEHFPDREHGEWFGYLHRDGRLSVPLKGNWWKGPFHLPRVLLYCWKMLEEKSSCGNGECSKS